MNTNLWYVLQSQVNKEELLFKQVWAREIEVFYPCVLVNPVNRRSKKIKPYFPGYLFVKGNLDELGYSLFQWMPYTFGLVFLGGEPATVADEFVRLLRRHLEQLNEQAKSRRDEFKRGDAIVIHSGPLSNYSGLFDSYISGTERVRIMLKMLNDRVVPIELSRALLEAQPA